MMKKLILLSLSIITVGLINSCGPTECCTVPEVTCLEDVAKGYTIVYGKRAPRPATVKKFRFNGEIVYMFDPGSGFEDWDYEVVNQECGVICTYNPSNGTDTCPDFEEFAEELETIWTDPR